MRWYHRLASKITLLGLALFFLITLAFVWQYYTIKKFMVESHIKKAVTTAERINSAIVSFVLKTPEGGGAIDKFLAIINSQFEGVRVRIVHSESINRDFGLEEDEKPRSDEERASLIDGERRFYETDVSYNYVVPFRSVNGCEACHFLPDGSGRKIPPGFILGLAVAEVATKEMNRELNMLFEGSAKFLLILALFIILLSLFINTKISRPIRKMLNTIKKFTSGDLKERISVEQKDEIGSLAEQFNSMADELGTSLKKLEDWNVQLKTEVDRQTKTVMEQAEMIMKMQDYYHAVIDSTPDIIYTTDTNFVIDSINAEWDIEAEKNGLVRKKADFIGKNLFDFIGGEEKEKYADICGRMISGEAGGKGDVYRTEFSVDEKGENKYFGLTISPLVEAGGRRAGLVFVSFDITQRKKAEEMLRIEMEKLDAIMNGMGAAVSIIDADDTIIYMNKVMEETFGPTSLGKKCYEVIVGTQNPCKDCDRLHQAVGASTELYAKNGKVYLSSRSPIVDEKGRMNTIEVLKDITYLKDMEKKLVELTITDNLTGLYNKRYFFNKLNEETTRALRQKQSLCLFFADIDKFKNFNDTYGHVEGDKCLAAVGEIINSSLRTHIDTGFRYGGEEFTVILPATNQKEAGRIAERIRDSFASNLFTPVVNGKRIEVYKTISIGVAVYGGKSLYGGETMESFVDRADTAMYLAKKKGGNRVETAR